MFGPYQNKQVFVFTAFIFTETNIPWNTALNRAGINSTLK